MKLYSDQAEAQGCSEPGPGLVRRDAVTKRIALNGQFPPRTRSVFRREGRKGRSPGRWEECLGSFDPYGLDGRVAVVTGAARGIGAEIARRLAELGATVVLADRSPNRSNDTREALSACGARRDWLVFDVTDSAVGRCRGRPPFSRSHGKVDILVANAGIAFERKAIEHSDDDWRAVMSVNLDGVFYCARAFARPMLDAGAGGDRRHLVDRRREGRAARGACRLRRVEGRGRAYVPCPCGRVGEAGRSHQRGRSRLHRYGAARRGRPHQPGHDGHVARRHAVLAG